MPVNKQTSATIAALAMFDAKVVTAEALVEDALKLAAHAVDVLKRQAFDGIAGGSMALGKGWLGELEVATRALDRMATAQINLDKTAKIRAGKLDAAGRYAAMMRYAKAEMPAAERSRFIRELAAYHQEVRRTPGPAPGWKTPVEEDVPEDAAVPEATPPGSAG